MYLDLTRRSVHTSRYSENRYFLHNSRVYFTKYIQMFITSEQIIAQVSAKKPNGVFLMYFIEKLYFWLPNEF